MSRAGAMTGPGMDAYSGFESQVREIRAVRTFRIGPQGRLYALLGNTAWSHGTTTARCQPPPPDQPGLHAAPSPDCSCGLYCYASDVAAAEHPNSRHVVAVVTCWGRVIAGTRGIRAEHARIEALWMSPKVPPNLAARVVSRYPGASMYERRSTMFAAHPPTKLGCYESAMPGRAFTRLGLQFAVAIALFVGMLSPHWLDSHLAVRLLWVAELGFFCVGRCGPGIQGQRRSREAAHAGLRRRRPVADSAVRRQRGPRPASAPRRGGRSTWRRSTRAMVATRQSLPRRNRRNRVMNGYLIFAVAVAVTTVIVLALARLLMIGSKPGRPRRPRSQGKGDRLNAANPATFSPWCEAVNIELARSVVGVRVAWVRRGDHVRVLARALAPSDAESPGGMAPTEDRHLERHL